MFPVREANFSSNKKPGFGATSSIHSSNDCVRFWEERLCLQRVGCGHGVTIIMGDTAGIIGRGGVEGLRGGGKGERNGW